ncbi:MAG: hypothetical protein KGI69_02030 [Patescibacteria group bacterium]|nr:hypothetical protein [Patescibacteria group bacterium]
MNTEELGRGIDQRIPLTNDAYFEELRKEIHSSLNRSGAGQQLGIGPERPMGMPFLTYEMLCHAHYIESGGLARFQERYRIGGDGCGGHSDGEVPVILVPAQRRPELAVACAA